MDEACRRMLAVLSDPDGAGLDPVLGVGDQDHLPRRAGLVVPKLRGLPTTTSRAMSLGRPSWWTAWSTSRSWTDSR
ncbi:hypothetical protein [Pedococcus ginsenosidimutans]|uniref:hypothetical protein n=1 Tax=Pedococcus ginsenosidimutans TaxID=490570 RepID=UPI0031E8DC91